MVVYLLLSKCVHQTEKLQAVDKEFHLSMKKSRIFQHQYHRQVEMHITLFLFDDWFLLEVVFIYSISLM